MARSTAPAGASRAALCLLAVVFAALAGVLDFVFLREVQDAQTQRAEWTAVPAHVDAARVVVRGHGKNRTHELEVRYRYTVAGEEHSGDGAGFGGMLRPGRKHLEDLTERLAADGSTDVLVDPDDPSVSTLDLGGPLVPGQMVLLLVFFNAIAGLMVTIAVAALRSGPPPVDVDPLAARFVLHANERHLVLRPARTPYALTLFGVFAIETFLAGIALGLAGNVTTGADRFALPALFLAAAGAIYVAETSRHKRDDLGDTLFVDRTAATWAFPADAAPRPVSELVHVTAVPRTPPTSKRSLAEYTFHAGASAKSPLLFRAAMAPEAAEAVRRQLENDSQPEETRRVA